ncbi:MAG TPA: long-chain fatty acid--CoA ligase [Anaerolineales bacterium]|nr:long-chain fatty acid--CoA ligase [Anaerolineales bacterium]
MQGQMMDYPLTLTPLLERARLLFPKKEIVTKAGPTLERITYGRMAERVARLATALEKLGVRSGDRVATFAWNNERHLELYFAVPCMGAVLHPLNLRLPADQLTYIVAHADDQILFVDPTLLPAIEKLAPQFKSVKHYVIMSDTVPEGTTLSPVHAYEDLLAEASPEYPWPHLDENQAAAMCYTSGTTGNPKGVVYSHRSIYLHSLGLSMIDSFGLTERDVFMPVVPMFHVLAWGTPFATVMLGTKLVFPGPHLQPRDLAELIQAEKVTLTAGVPTLWLGLLALLDKERYDLSSLRGMIVGGAAAPQSMIEAFEKKHGLNVIHAWGMTEMSPLGTVSHLKSYQEELPEEQRFAIRAKQGLSVPGVEIRAVDESGKEVPWDGKAFGELQVRGPWIISSYYHDDRSADSFMDGWFRTGDVVTIDPEGFVQIVDRTKDLVKSGGEWISSQDLENVIMAHPKVLEAAVIAVPHPKWQERPLACVVPKPDYKDNLTKAEIYDHLRARFAKMYLPDDIVFIEAVPKTSVGKFDKKVLREKYKDYQLPE